MDAIGDLAGGERSAGRCVFRYQLPKAASGAALWGGGEQLLGSSWGSFI